MASDAHDVVGAQQTRGAGTSGEDRHLDEELGRWVAAAVITAEQADEIRRIEASERHRVPPPSRTPLVVEALGLLGGALAAIAGVVATSRFWDQFSSAVRLIVLGAVAALLIAAGRVVRREGEPALAHLGSFLWVLATGTAAFWGVVLALDALGWEGADVVFVAGLVALVAAAALWAWRAAPLQHLATLTAVAVTAGGVAGQVAHVGSTYIGIALWAVGVAWMVLAWTDVVKPIPLGYAAGGLLAVGGGVVVGSEGVWGDVLAIVTALALLAASVPIRSMVLLWVGVAGVFVSVPMTIFEHFGHSVGVPVALFLAGMTLIGVAVGASRLVREVRAVATKPVRFSQRGVSRALLGVVGLVVVLTVGLTQIRMTDVPTFPSLRQAPDTGLQGSIAFVRPDDARPCVYVIAASGTSAERKLLCERGIGEGLGNLDWNQANNVVAIEYSEDGPLQAVEIDPADGRVVTRGPSGGFGDKEGKAFFEGSIRSTDGASLVVEDAASGKTRLLLRTTSGTTRTLLTTKGPRDYRFEYATWSPGGTYAVVVDSEHRLLIVGVESSMPTARVLVTDATSPAWSAWAA